MAQASNTPPVVSYTSATSGLQPYSSGGLARRDFTIAATAGSYLVDVTNNSLSGMTGLVTANLLSVCSNSQSILLCTSTSNGDGTVGPFAGPWRSPATAS